ncbi:TPA: hypothetical protein N0F65_008865 [Lagenidium giganteum]|uniref:glucan endo-1,3-beta-D-glucosidase n=1 Tax=Lagenidium giganteum TaxID=4803 RepID=A0AAV2YGD8_9STRA|nr:TPA: hypothetical protein N0F65_008865 [Lagenidium giganteum]
MADGGDVNNNGVSVTFGSTSGSGSNGDVLPHTDGNVAPSTNGSGNLRGSDDSTPAPAPAPSDDTPVPAPADDTPAPSPDSTPAISRAGASEPIVVPAREDFTLFEVLNTEQPSSELVKHSTDHVDFLPPRFMAPGIVGSRAIPTNNWWGNMIAATKETRVESVWTNPYSVRPSLSTAPFGLNINYPYRSRAFGGRTGNGDAVKFYLHGLLNEVTFSTSEFSSTAPNFEVYDWDDLSVQTRMFANGDRAKKIEFTLVSGMAYVSARYTELTPRIESVYAIVKINGQGVSPGSKVTSDRFVIDFNSGEAWVLYLSSTTTMKLDGVTALVAAGKFSGLARIAFVPDNGKLSVVDKSRQCVVEGGNVDARDETAYAFNWKTSGNCDGGLLHYAQIHHVDTLDTSTTRDTGLEAYSTTRGKMQALVTTSSPPVWKFQDSSDIVADFYPRQRPSSEDVSKYNMRETLEKDIGADWNMPSGGSYYFCGKWAQKYASLCLMGNDYSVVGDDKALKDKCVAKLQQTMTRFMTNNWDSPLVYDKIYRGIVSTEGFKAHDPNADFGNTMYNDHHFHYGYWILASAVLNYLSPDWSGLRDLKRMTNLLVRDVANPSWDDQYFPKFRNFDWFRGHSYSHGVTPFADGKDEESTSEDINFHYALTLFGRATNNHELANVGSLMLRLNARAVKTYFLMTDDNRAQPTNFRGNKVTGILFDNKADYATWFSPEKYCIHGIQMLPFSPVTEYVRTKQFVQEEWDQVLSHEAIVKNNDMSNPWLSLLYVNYATVDKQTALDKLTQVSLDDGLSRSWALYMAASHN